MLLKKIVFTVGLFLSSFVGVFGDNSLNTNSLLKSISDVETGGWHGRIGAAGERSQYQIKSDVWKKYSSIPFWKASLRDYQSEARRVAICYINEIAHTLDERNVSVDHRSIALRWNGGINRTHFLRRHISYADRVSNLYNHYETVADEKTVTKKQYEPLRIVLTLDTIDDAPSVHFVQPKPSKSITVSRSDAVFMPPIIASM